MIGKISNQISSLHFMLEIFTLMPPVFKSKTMQEFQDIISCLKTIPIFDQVVKEKAAKGASQGCAFVTLFQCAGTHLR